MTKAKDRGRRNTNRASHRDAIHFIAGVERQGNEPTTVTCMSEAVDAVSRLESANLVDKALKWTGLQLPGLQALEYLSAQLHLNVDDRDPRQEFAGRLTALAEGPPWRQKGSSQTRGKGRRSGTDSSARDSSAAAGSTGKARRRASSRDDGKGQARHKKTRCQCPRGCVAVCYGQLETLCDFCIPGEASCDLSGMLWRTKGPNQEGAGRGRIDSRVGQL